MRLASLLVTFFFVACGEDSNKRPDMCADTRVVGGACAQPNEVAMGNCFESSRCVCVFPEALWVCCYAGYGGLDAPGKAVGDPCCGPSGTSPSTPGYPCFCDGTHHWTCPMDLGATD